jgi:hypothetical protein
VVEQGCLTRTQMTGERNDGHRHHSAMVPHRSASSDAGETPPQVESTQDFLL